MGTQIRDTGPSVIDKFIGQPNVIAQVKVALEASWSEGTRLPHMLFVGPPGVGKTELARVLAAEMGVSAKESLGQSLNRDGYLAGFLMAAAEKDVLFLDEAHELKKPAQTLLYRAMAEGKLLLGGKTFGSEGTAVTLPSFTLLAATTDEYLLTKPLRDRFEMTLRFDFYATTALEEVLRQRAQQIGVTAEEAAIAAIASRGKGTPRLALNLLQSARRVAASTADRGPLRAEHVERACELEGLDRLGLDPTEQAYLLSLAKADKPVPLNVLAALLGLPAATVAGVTELLLLRLGFIERGKRGRELTAAGKQYVDNAPSAVEGTVG